MKSILPKSSRGFTLIELLIVIALLGALAVGLIGAIDPFEQLKKGTDTGSRDVVSQVQTAIIRYYAIKNALPPWPTLPNGDPITASGVLTANMAPAFNDIILAGELRSDFVDIQGKKLDTIYITAVQGDSATSTTITVCYTPGSKSFQADPSTKYSIDHKGTVVTDNSCKSQGGTVNCDWCIQ